jgi:hypothetical protein
MKQFHYPLFLFFSSHLQILSQGQNALSIPYKIKQCGIREPAKTRNRDWRPVSHAGQFTHVGKVAGTHEIRKRESLRPKMEIPRRLSNPASVGIRKTSRNSHQRPGALPGAHLEYLSLTCYRSNQLEFTVYNCQFKARCLDYLATRSNHQGLSPRLRTQLHDSNSSQIMLPLWCAAHSHCTPIMSTQYKGQVTFNKSIRSYRVYTSTLWPTWCTKF